MARICSWVFLTLLLTGCGPGEKLVPVSGRITRDGKPLAGVHVSFQPRSATPGAASAGPGSFGQADADGRYTLRSVATDREGAVAGRHEVRLSMPPVSTSNDDLPPTADVTVPADFRNGKTTFTVPASGTDQADFELGK